MLEIFLAVVVSEEKKRIAAGTVEDHDDEVVAHETFQQRHNHTDTSVDVEQRATKARNIEQIHQKARSCIC